MNKERFYTVEQTGVLFGVNSEKVRRWRIKGIGGTRLKAHNDRYDSDGELIKQKGTPVFFSESALKEFLKANPQLNTPQLTAEFAGGSGVESVVARPAINSDVQAHVENQVQVARSFTEILLRQRQELVEQIKDIDLLLAKYEGK